MTPHVPAMTQGSLEHLRTEAVHAAESHNAPSTPITITAGELLWLIREREKLLRIVELASKCGISARGKDAGPALKFMRAFDRYEEEKAREGTP